MKIYEIFAGENLKIAEKIQQRRYQMLVHSCIYYALNQNIITDAQWNTWAIELRDLQKQYPDISKKVTLYEYFKDWDASTGAFLPIELNWVMEIAHKLLNIHQRPKNEIKKTVRRKLF